MPCAAQVCLASQPGSVLLQCCYQLRARNSGQRPPVGVSSRIGRLARSPSIQPRPGLAHHESCGSSRQRNRYISDLSCLSASHVCVHWNPIAGFLRENLILLLLLRWLAGSGQGVGGSYFYFGGGGAEQWLSKDEADFCRYDDVLRFRIRIRGGGLLPGGPHYLLLLLHPCPSALASDGFPPRLQYLDYPTTASPAITFISCLNISLVRAPSLFCRKPSLI